MIRELLPLTENKLKLLSFIYLQKESHLLDIAKNFNLHPFSVQKTLKSIRKVLSQKKSGKTIVLELDSNNKNYLELLFLIEDYLLSVNKNLQPIIKNLKEFFSTDKNILCCCLFGSSVRGKVKGESDIDVLFVVSPNYKEMEIIRSCSTLSSILGREIMPLIMNEKKFLTSLKLKEPTISTLLESSQRLIVFGKEYFLRRTVK